MATTQPQPPAVPNIVSWRKNVRLTAKNIGAIPNAEVRFDLEQARDDYRHMSNFRFVTVTPDFKFYCDEGDHWTVAAGSDDVGTDRMALYVKSVAGDVGIDPNQSFRLPVGAWAVCYNIRLGKRDLTVYNVVEYALQAGQ